MLALADLGDGEHERGVVPRRAGSCGPLGCQALGSTLEPSTLVLESPPNKARVARPEMRGADELAKRSVAVATSGRRGRRDG